MQVLSCSQNFCLETQRLFSHVLQRFPLILLRRMNNNCKVCNLQLPFHILFFFYNALYDQHGPSCFLVKFYYQQWSYCETSNHVSFSTTAFSSRWKIKHSQLHWRKKRNGIHIKFDAIFFRTRCSKFENTIVFLVKVILVLQACQQCIYS